MVLRVLAISHPAVAPAYRRKFEIIAESGEVDLRLVVPEAWPEESTRIRVDAHGVPDWVTPLPVAFEGFYTRYYFKRGLQRLFRQFRPDVVHVEEEPFSFCAGQVFGMARRHSPGACLIFRTSLSREIKFKMLGRPILRLIERRVLRRADSAFVLSAAGGERLRRRGYRGDIREFPNGVDTSVFHSPEPESRARIRRELGVDDGFVVGYVGRLILVKGVDTLLDATADLEGVRLLIVGDGSLRSQLETHANELGLGPRAVFTGTLPPAEVAEMLGAMDAFVLPSRTSPTWVEFFGRVLVEAMACGVPVIGSHSGEIPGTIGDAGLTFREGDTDGLARTIRRLREDPDLASELRSRGLERVQRDFAWEAVAARTREAYLDIAASAARRA